MKEPIDRILEALESHPDPFCARKLAEQELDELIGSDESGCEFCDGVGLCDRYDEGVEDGEDRGIERERRYVVEYLRGAGHVELANQIDHGKHLQ